LKRVSLVVEVGDSHKEKLQSGLYVPMVAKGQVIGVVMTQRLMPNRYSEAEAKLLALVANTAAAAIQNARLFEAERVSRQQAESLAHTAARLNMQLDLDAVLNAVCEETARALNVPAVAVFLQDQHHDVFSIAALTGLPQKYQADYIPTPSALYEENARQRGPIILASDVQSMPGLPNAALNAEMNIRTTASASMLREGRFVGQLTALTFQIRQFTDNELSLLGTLADQAVQAITNARLFEQEQAPDRTVCPLRSLSRAGRCGRSKCDPQYRDAPSRRDRPRHVCARGALGARSTRGARGASRSRPRP
jgi:GAF domain-containing protein